MATIIKAENFFPAWTGELFDTGKLLNSRLFDLDGEAFNLAKRVPSVNITENDKEFRIEMAAPGLDKKDFKVEVENGLLCISSEKEEETTEEKKNYTRREYSFNSFSRSFTLPENSLPEKINASYQNGILSIVLPKKEVSVLKTAKEIQVS